MVLNADAVEKNDPGEAYRQGWTGTDIYEAANYTLRNLAVELLLKAYKIDGQGAFAWRTMLDTTANFGTIT